MVAIWKTLYNLLRPSRLNFRELTKTEFQRTFDEKMVNVTASAKPAADIWPYVKMLVKAKVVLENVYKEGLVSHVYENSSGTYHHVLLPTYNKNIFVVILVGLLNQEIIGHHILDLEKEYGLRS